MKEQLYIDALLGAGTGDIDNSIRLEKLGFVEFTGNQNNEKWEWKKKYLHTLTLSELEKLYEEIKGYR
jgi:hypothetical protein